jgi:hypothetical protein
MAVIMESAVVWVVKLYMLEEHVAPIFRVVEKPSKKPAKITHQAELFCSLGVLLGLQIIFHLDDRGDVVLQKCCACKFSALSLQPSSFYCRCT